MENKKRLIEIPEDGIVRIGVMRGEDTVGERRIDLSFLPTVDAAEVVRCCDCQYCDVYQKEAYSETILMCMIHSFELVDPTDYCSRGERKDND